MRAELIVLSIMATGTALASSPDAWDALFKKAREACVKVSDLKQARAAGRPVDFQGSVLVVVDGHWPQPHMKNARARFACLYDKKTGMAEAQELPER